VERTGVEQKSRRRGSKKNLAAENPVFIRLINR
jgi:hypothetical protein